MWVVKQDKQHPERWLVGYFLPTGEFEAPSSWHYSFEAAAQQCHYLNGGIGREGVMDLIEALDRRK